MKKGQKEGQNKRHLMPIDEHFTKSVQPCFILGRIPPFGMFRNVYNIFLGMKAQAFEGG